MDAISVTVAPFPYRTRARHLLAVRKIGEPIPPADLRFTADPGTALIDLAFELGHRQIMFRDRKTVLLDEGAQATLNAAVRALEEKFGRPPGPDDPIFFDPDADEPRPMQPEDMEEATTTMLEAAGIGGAWIYAHQHTDGLLPRPDGGFNSDADRRDWDQAIDRYLRTHPGQAVDHDRELGKLRMALAAFSIQGAATDPALGASLAQRLDRGRDLDGEADVVADLLDGSAGWLTESLADPDVARRAAELARAWAGADLASRVRQAATAPPDSADVDLAVLLAVAAATLARPA